MNFVFHTRKQLPHLAWCVCILPEDSSVTVWHGDWVEVWQDGFVEGAWDAPFAERGFEKALTFAGTGGILRDDALRLVSGTDLQARLYSTQAAGAIFASNSLPFVVARGAFAGVSGLCSQSLGTPRCARGEKQRPQIPAAALLPLWQSF